MEVCVKINCLHDECIEVSLRDDSPPLKSIPWEPDFEKAAELNNTVIKTMRGQKVTKKGLNLRGQAKEENLAEKSKQKIKLLRESIIKEIHDGISQSS